MYSSKDLAIIIPTKDRPEEIELLLKSILNQKLTIGKIIIVSSGIDISSNLDKYFNIAIEHYITEPGQILQRNYAISKLDGTTKLVATLDDDIQFKDNAICEMIDFWNSIDSKTAGVGFNIINLPKHKSSILKDNLFYMTKTFPGMIMKSGITTSLCNVDKDIKTEWLNGEATVWKQEILINNKHKPIKSKWAVFEDVIYSYPIGINHLLYVAQAK